MCEVLVSLIGFADLVGPCQALAVAATRSQQATECADNGDQRAGRATVPVVIELGTVEQIFQQGVVQPTECKRPAQPGRTARADHERVPQHGPLRSVVVVELVEPMDAWGPREAEPHPPAGHIRLDEIPDRSVAASCSDGQRPVQPQRWPGFGRPEPVGGRRELVDQGAGVLRKQPFVHVGDGHETLQLESCL